MAQVWTGLSLSLPMADRGNQFKTVIFSFDDASSEITHCCFKKDKKFLVTVSERMQLLEFMWQTAIHNKSPLIVSHIYTNTARQGTERASKHPISLTQTHRTALGFVLLSEILSKHLSLFSLLHPLSHFLILVWMWSLLCEVFQSFIAL